MKIGIVRLVAAAASAAETPSYRERLSELQEALPEVYIVDFTDSVVIYQDNIDKFYQRGYSLDDKGEVVLGGDAVEVEKEVSYVKVQAASRIMAAGEASDGFKWRVQIAEAGPVTQGIDVYPYEALKAGAPLYEGARVFALTEAQHTAGNHPFGKSVRDIVGVLSDVTVNAKGPEGTLTILKSAQWFRDMLVSAWDAGQKDLLGLSHDIMGKVTMKGGKRILDKIVKVDSVDVVYDPIAGGKFLRMAAAAQAGHKEADMFKRLLAALKAMRPDLLGKIESLEAKGEAVTDADISQLLAAAGGMQTVDIDRLIAAMKTDSSTLDEARQVLTQARIVACANTLTTELGASGLPELSREKIKKQFDGVVFETEKLTAAVKDEKEYLDKLTASGVVTGVGGRIGDIQGEPERLQAALDKLFGVKVDDKFSDVPAMTSLRAAYTRITGDTSVKGQIDRDHEKLGVAIMDMMRMPAAYSSSSFSFVLGNTMYRRLVQEYRAVDYNEDLIISFIRNAVDFKTMEIIQVGYFGDLPDVNPETGDFEEMNMPTDLEATYSLNQKGVILTITRKVIINDDLKSVSSLVNKLGRAARRTHARRCWNKLISNANYKGDTTALFHANHGNLGSTALTNDATGIATLTARLQALYNQKEQDSTEVLGLEGKYLAVPRALLEIGKGLNSPWPGVAGGNPHAGRFGANHENIITNPLFTDVTDWYLLADKNEVEMLEAAYLNGQREPELFVADNPLVGQMFVGDKIQYKERHEYEFEIADFRGMDKSVVAG